MKFGAFIATYNRPASLQKTIEVILSQSRSPDLILVVDNANSGEAQNVVRNFPQDRVVYEGMKDNLGSAGGTAYGVRWLYEQGYDAIYCGDDDDPPAFPDTMERLLKVLTESSRDVGGAGAVGARWDWQKGKLIRFPDETLKGVLDVDVIGGNAHLILKRDGVKDFGSPRSDLFFGYPDVEYCLRIRKAGYRLVIDGDLMKKYREKFKSVKRYRTESFLPQREYGSIWRNYYTTRNYIFMMKNTFHRPDLAVRQSIKAFAGVPLSWLRGPKYGAAFSRLQLRAIWDGYSGKLGCTVLPGEK
jgi:glycosyltransferase involved in cell wall biosynthesis